jgi:hypothetical protein
VAVATCSVAGNITLAFAGTVALVELPVNDGSVSLLATDYTLMATYMIGVQFCGHLEAAPTSETLDACDVWPGRLDFHFAPGKNVGVALGRLCDVDCGRMQQCVRTY